jgi:hypothetical protein
MASQRRYNLGFRVSGLELADGQDPVFCPSFACS